MNNVFVEVPGSEEALEVTPHGVSVVNSTCWPAYSCFVVWANSEFFLVERESDGSIEGLEHAGRFWNLSELLHRGVRKFYHSVYGNTSVYTARPLGRFERLIVITSTDDYGCIVYPSGARYDGFAARLVDDFVVSAVYHSGYLFEAEYVYGEQLDSDPVAMLWEACRQSLAEDYSYWESRSIFDGEAQLYRVRELS